MEIVLESRTYSLGNPFKSGGEADVFLVHRGLAAKIYHAHLHDADERRLKVLALCNSHENNIQQFGGDAFAFPHTPAFRQAEVFADICGFGMKFFDGVTEVVGTGFDINRNQFKDVGGNRFTDKSAVEFIYSTFQLIEQLHKSRIILGDVNPRNLMVRMSTGSPVLVDLDSAQIGGFKCPGHSPDYIDPLVQSQGHDPKGAYLYSIGADIFAMACVLFEFIVGVHPFSLRVTPALNNEQKKRRDMSYFHVVDAGRTWPSGAVHMSNPLDALVVQRLATLGALDAKLVAFFRDVIADGGRANLIESLDRSDPRHPAFGFYSTSGFNTILVTLLGARQAAATSVRMPDPGFGRTLTTFATRSAVGVTLPDTGFATVATAVHTRTVGVTSAVTPAAVASPPSVSPDIALTMFASQYELDLSALL